MAVSVLPLRKSLCSSLRNTASLLVKPRGRKAGLKHPRPRYRIPTILTSDRTPRSPRITSRPRVLRQISGQNIAYGEPTSIDTLVTHRTIQPPVEKRVPAPLKIPMLSSCFQKLQLNAALWNARSISGKIGAIIASLIEDNLDILVVTETWLKSQSDPTLAEFHSSITGYNVYHQSRSGRRGGGVAVIARSNLRAEEKQPGSFRSFESLDVLLKVSSQSLRVITIYRPPKSQKNGSTFNEFLTEFSTLLESVVPSACRLVIAGDFNLHLDDTDAPDTADYHRIRIQEADDKGLFNIIAELSDAKTIIRKVLPSQFKPATLPSEFLDYFNSKILRLREGLPSPHIDNDNVLPSHTLPCFNQVTTDQVNNIILQASSKSCDLDVLPVKYIKKFADALLPFMTHLFNSSLSSGSVPSHFKSAIIRPLLKKTDLNPNILKNYRPVSNLSFLSKVLERIVAAQLNTHLRKYCLFTKFQSAYRAHHSTETALMRVHNDIMLALNDKKDVVLVMLDLSAAFDTVDHEVLLHRLQFRFGITGTALSWFRSYLNNRTQCVKVGSATSSSTHMKSGVPQGSVLGPILFTLYTAPLEDIIVQHGLNHMLYADDTQIYVVCNKPDEVQGSIEVCVDDIRAWMKSNMLILNDDKTEVVQFSSGLRSDVVKLPSLRIGEFDIAPSATVRNLGVTLDQSGSMCDQISHICRNGFYALSRIGKIRQLLDKSTTEKMVHAFITSRLDYCNGLLYGINKIQLQRLQSLQNAAARLISRTRKFDHITPVLIDLHWLPVEARIKFKIMLTVYKVIHRVAPLYLIDLIELYTPARDLRSADSLRLVPPYGKFNKSYGQKAFSVSAPSLWNSLPAEIRNATSVDCFKRQLFDEEPPHVGRLRLITWVDPMSAFMEAIGVRGRGLSVFVQCRWNLGGMSTIGKQYFGRSFLMYSEAKFLRRNNKDLDLCGRSSAIDLKLPAELEGTGDPKRLHFPVFSTIIQINKLD
ncbi:uncharacterized protein [Ptychodera flava]|uniref:uncharacterized protein n=1 Tax=Ptychodera flava TaxID=63121 RepID=UPI00396A151C